MINHARTLLLNESPTNRPAFDDHGEEYIPAAFTAQSLPSYLTRLRSIFLGTRSDPLYQNFRLAQLMGVLHSNDVAREYVLGLDGRYTYRPFGGSFVEYGFGATVRALGATTMVLETVGDSSSNDNSGRASFSWRAQTAAGPRLVVHSAWDDSIEEHDLVFTDERSQLIQVENQMYLRLFVPAGSWAAGVCWKVESLTRPSTDLGVLLARAKGVGAKTIAAVFQDASASFRNLWENGVSLPDELGGLLSAMIMKMDTQYNA